MATLNPPDPATITVLQMVSSVRRELAMRKRVYPKWVDAGRMMQADAEREIACMVAVLGYLGADTTGELF